MKNFGIGGRLQKGGFLSGPTSFLEPGRAERDVYLDPIPLKVIKTGFDDSVPWVKIVWDAGNREVKAYVTKLYIPQDPIYSF